MFRNGEFQSHHQKILESVTMQSLAISDLLSAHYCCYHILLISGTMLTSCCALLSLSIYFICPNDINVFQCDARLFTPACLSHYVLTSLPKLTKDGSNTSK